VDLFTVRRDAVDDVIPASDTAMTVGLVGESQADTTAPIKIEAEIHERTVV
jgi:hypothetical protein